VKKNHPPVPRLPPAPSTVPALGDVRSRLLADALKWSQTPSTKDGLKCTNTPLQRLLYAEFFWKYMAALWKLKHGPELFNSAL